MNLIKKKFDQSYLFYNLSAQFEVRKLNIVKKNRETCFNVSNSIHID